MRYKDHKLKWSKCTRCDLYKTRDRVVLARGKIPCDILMIGEGPGASEDVLGKPFVGPAGHLLDQWIEEAQEQAGTDLPILITNLIACIPLKEDGSKTDKPPGWAVEACAIRLRQLFCMANPRFVVFIGSEAKRHAPKSIGDLTNYLTSGFDFDGCSADVIHPAAVLRMRQPQRGLACQRAVVALRGAFEEGGIPF